MVVTPDLSNETKSVDLSVKRPEPLSSISHEVYEQVLEKFASLLGTNSELKGVAHKGSYVLGKYLLKDESDPLGGSVCVLPSLDIFSGDIPDSSVSSSVQSKGDSSDVQKHTEPQHEVQEKSDLKSKLPDETQTQSKMGDSESKSVSDASVRESSSSDDKKYETRKKSIPPMAASVLGFFPPSNTKTGPQGAQNDTSNKIESKSNGDTKTANLNEVGNTDSYDTLLENAILKNLSSKMSWTRSSLHLAPSAMLQSLSASFTYLLEARVRSCTLLLLKHSLARGDSRSRSNLMQLLVSSSAIDLSSIVTKFEALKLPPEIRQQIQEQAKEEDAEKSSDEKKFIEAVCPLMFEASMNMKMPGYDEMLSLRTSGTIKGQFLRNTLDLKQVDVELDISTIVTSMIKQARKVVFAAAAGINSPPPMGSLPKMRNASNKGSLSRKLNISSNDFQLASVENLQINPQRLKFQKPQDKDKSNDDQSRRRNLSVSWNVPPVSSSTSFNPTKKPKMSLSGYTLKSSKSFGKPDASLFQSQKNATFAEFGRPLTNRGVPKFLNGRLSKTHTMTVQNFAQLNEQATEVGASISKNRNDSFSQINDSISNGLKGKDRNSSYSQASTSISNMLGLHNNRRNGSLSQASTSISNMMGLRSNRTQNSAREVLSMFSTDIPDNLCSRNMHVLKE